MVDIESPPEPFSGRFEMDFVLFSFVIFFARTVIAGASAVPAPGNPVAIVALVYDAAGVSLAMMAVLLLATKRGYAWAAALLVRDKGTRLALLVALVPLAYAVAGVEAGFPQFSSLSTTLASAPFAALPYWANAMLASTGVFVGLKTCLAFSLLREPGRGLVGVIRSDEPAAREFRAWFAALLLASPLLLLVNGLGWFSLLAPAGVFLLFLLARIPAFNRNATGMSFGDFLVAALPAGILIAFQPVLPLLWTWTVPVAALVLMVPTGLGREHVHFSFVPRSGRELIGVIHMMLVSLVIFIPLASVVGFIDPVATWNPESVSVVNLVEYVGTWVYIVGISEEFIFRCGLLILVKDGLRSLDARRDLHGTMGKIAKHPYVSAMVVSAVVFGLAHAGKGLDYAFLAALAGILYGLPYVKYKTLFGPIMLHAFVDVIAVAFFAAPL